MSANSPSRKQLGNLSPPVSKNGVGFVNNDILFIRPGALFDQWIKMVVPTLTTLFTHPAL